MNFLSENSYDRGEGGGERRLSSIYKKLKISYFLGLKKKKKKERKMVHVARACWTSQGGHQLTATLNF